ncbi:MAG: mechanosensitive ion channel [Prolixibacteraceae bacterium]|nr:mechanosensitive ion channel [Prolixibacteraceae bacterium]
MFKKIRIPVLLCAFMLLGLILWANTPDSLTIHAEEKGNVLKTVEEDTRSLSAYFSVSKIILTLIILALTYLFVKIITGILKIWAERNTRNRVTIKGLIPLAAVIIWVASLTFILVAVFSPPMASLIAFAASVGVAVGFAAQDLLKNVFGGIVIIFDKPFQIGDKIEIGNDYGEVVSIGLRSTRIVTPDDSLVSVPNLEVMNQAVSNANAGEGNCQVVTELFFHPGINIREMKRLCFEAAQVSKHIYLNKPVNVIVLHEKVGSRIMLKVRIKAYVNDIRNEFIFKSELTELLTARFSDEIPLLKIDE